MVAQILNNLNLTCSNCWWTAPAVSKRLSSCLQRHSLQTLFPALLGSWLQRIEPSVLFSLTTAITRKRKIGRSVTWYVTKQQSITYKSYHEGKWESSDEHAFYWSTADRYLHAWPLSFSLFFGIQNSWTANLATSKVIIIVSVKRCTDCLIKVCNKVLVTRWALALKVAPTALWNRSRVAISCYHCYQRGLRLNQEEAASWEGLPGGQEGCLLVEHPE